MELYSYAWFVSFAISFAVYTVLTRALRKDQLPAAPPAGAPVEP